MTVELVKRLIVVAAAFAGQSAWSASDATPSAPARTAAPASAPWKPNNRDCAKEQLAGVTAKAERERRAVACVRRGEFKPSPPKTF